jgi:hypothetical protein
MSLPASLELVDLSLGLPYESFITYCISELCNDLLVLLVLTVLMGSLNKLDVLYFSNGVFVLGASLLYLVVFISVFAANLLFLPGLSILKKLFFVVD